MMHKEIHISPLLIGVICLLVGGAGGYLFSLQIGETEDINPTDIRQASEYTFISPLLECETATAGNIQKYIPFEKDTLKKIQSIQDANKDVNLSVYFRNLQNGPSFGIKEGADFSPASLMKLPILFMYLKWKDTDPSVLERILIPTIANTLAQKYEPESKIVTGTGYTIANLLYHLIAYSDNTASNTLISYAPQELQDQVYTDLNIPSPKDISYSLSVKEYAYFFRILYNASYLSRDSSESALHLLSLSTFTGGLTGKLPSDLVVAHKFGERESNENGQHINQLHDCGIVYYTPYPYLLCIMTRGDTDMDRLSGIIQDTSKTIYDEVSGIYKKSF